MALVKFSELEIGEKFECHVRYGIVWEKLSKLDKEFYGNTPSGYNAVYWKARRGSYFRPDDMVEKVEDK